VAFRLAAVVEHHGVDGRVERAVAVICVEQHEERKLHLLDHDGDPVAGLVRCFDLGVVEGDRGRLRVLRRRRVARRGAGCIARRGGGVEGATESSMGPVLAGVGSSAPPQAVRSSSVAAAATATAAATVEDARSGRTAGMGFMWSSMRSNPEVRVRTA
jgi:hypothetical protein